MALDGAQTLLSAPEFPVGRERELARLEGALDAAIEGKRVVAMVAGRAGVGKSSLVHQLLAFTQLRGGWFVAGKFDQHNETEAIAVMQALGALGRLLLAGSAQELADARGRIVRSLGVQAALARVVPEFADLLSDVPAPRAINPAHAAARMAEVVVGLLRALASRSRPLVLVLDDLQWSGGLVIRIVDAVLAATDLEGLLLVGAYRDDEVPQAHPLALAVARWRAEAERPEFLQLSALRVPAIASLLERMLDAPPRAANRLARALAPHARGNPYDTIELLNALRDRSLLVGFLDNSSGADAAVRSYLCCTDVRAVLAARISQLPAASRELLQSCACLGAQSRRDAARSVLSAAAEFDKALQVLCDRGFVLQPEPGDGFLRLRHDRVQQAAYDSLQPPDRGRFHLALARRLSAREGLEPLAADQYCFAVEEVRDSDECLRAARFLRRAAAQARLIGNHTAAHGLQKAALRLLDTAQSCGRGEPAALAACEIEYHLALYCVGRLNEADAIFRRIEARGGDALGTIDAACAQVGSLSNRDRLDDAFDLGLRVLHELGLSAARSVGPDDFPERYERLRRWVAAFDLERECARPEATEPRVVAAAKMFEKLVSPAILKDTKMLAWLILQTLDFWAQFGPCGPMMACFSRVGSMTIALMQDARTGYLAVRQALDLCEARGWDLETSQVRCAFISHSIHWFEPLERKLTEAQRAREELLAVGNLRDASFTGIQIAACLFECGPSLRIYAEEVEAALSLSRRADNRQGVARCLADRQLLRALLGEEAFPVLPEESYLADGVALGWMVSYRESTRVIASAILGDREALVSHARSPDALRKSPQIYPITWGYWLSGLAAAWQLQVGAQARAGDGRDWLSELDESIAWLRVRAVDAPFNFRHMFLHLVAERAWALGDPEEAARSFDEALDAVEQTVRPWHQALVTERAARLHFALGWSHSAAQLLLEAEHLYSAWGARSKAARLAAETAGLGGATTRLLPGDALQARCVDTLAALRASQELAAEVDVQKLKHKVEEVVRAVAGATKAVLACWSDDAAEWVHVAADGSVVIVSSAPSLLPLGVFRFAERTREPLVIDDAVVDDRCTRDAYFRGLERCSLMFVPILHLGALYGMLFLENSATRRAFGSREVDAVTMIASQLAVSLESAQLYERLQRRVDEQARELREMQARLLDEARRAGMAQIAINVLHNIGNVLTSVNVSVHTLTSRIRQSRASRLSDLPSLIEEHCGDLAGFFAPGARGRRLPDYLRELALALEAERAELLEEIESLRASVDQIKNVVAVQQSYASEALVASPLTAIAVRAEIVQHSLSPMARS